MRISDGSSGLIRGFPITYIRLNIITEFFKKPICIKL
uniref:Uncharacterized protein n=1 Tax=Schistosoma japonicum TaxID=6182 RepID=Q5C3V8_SCHJA|nr:unknown [Schistosoma japonicum]